MDTVHRTQVVMKIYKINNNKMALHSKCWNEWEGLQREAVIVQELELSGESPK